MYHNINIKFSKINKLIWGYSLDEFVVYVDVLI